MTLVLHLATERGWGGGENQTALLIDGFLQGRMGDLRAELAAPPGSRLAEAFTGRLPSSQIHAWAPRNELDLNAAWRLARLANRRGAHIVHAHTARAHGMAWLAKSLFGMSATVIVHRRTQFPLSEGLLAQSKYRSPRIAKFVAISHASARALETLVPKDRLAIIPSAFPVDQFTTVSRTSARTALEKRFPIPASAFLVGTLGSLTDNKNVSSLLAAWPKLVAGLPDQNLHLIIGGKGPAEERLRAQAQGLGSEIKIVWAGHVENSPEYLAALDLFVMPSLQEGLGGAAIEAALAGTPVAASAVGGLLDVISPDATGYLFTPQSEGSLVETLSRAITNVDKRLAMAERARSEFQKRYSLEALWASTASIYREVLAK